MDLVDWWVMSEPMCLPNLGLKKWPIFFGRKHWWIGKAAFFQCECQTRTWQIPLRDSASIWWVVWQSLCKVGNEYVTRNNSAIYTYIHIYMDAWMHGCRNRRMPCLTTETRALEYHQWLLYKWHVLHGDEQKERFSEWVNEWMSKWTSEQARVIWALSIMILYSERLANIQKTIMTAFDSIASGILFADWIRRELQVFRDERLHVVQDFIDGCHGHVVEDHSSQDGLKVLQFGWDDLSA